MRTRELIEQAVLKAKLGRKGKVRDELYDFALDALNRNYKDIYSQFTWDNVKIFNLQVTTDTEELILPESVEIVLALRIEQRPLFPLHEIKVNNIAPHLFEDTGTVYHFHYRPDSPLLIQPTVATTLRTFSSSDLDTGVDAFVVRIEGTVAGEDDFEEIELTGTVPATTAKEFTAVRNIHKPDTTGRITVDDGVLVLGTIAPWHQQAHYKTLALLPPPSEIVTVTLLCTRRFQKLISDNDGTVIPDADEAMVFMLTAELLEFEREEERATYYRNIGRAKLNTIGKRDLEHQSKDITLLPEFGHYGDLGEFNGDHDRFDTSITGIGTRG